eukprot:9912732-Lingulodinium_polyedra.AAC.1
MLLHECDTMSEQTMRYVKEHLQKLNLVLGSKGLVLRVAFMKCIARTETVELAKTVVPWGLKLFFWLGGSPPPKK